MDTNPQHPRTSSTTSSSSSSSVSSSSSASSTSTSSAPISTVPTTTTTTASHIPSHTLPQPSTTSSPSSSSPITTNPTATLPTRAPVPVTETRRVTRSSTAAKLTSPISTAPTRPLKRRRRTSSHPSATPSSSVPLRAPSTVPLAAVSSVTVPPSPRSASPVSSSNAANSVVSPTVIPISVPTTNRASATNPSITPSSHRAVPVVTTHPSRAFSSSLSFPRVSSPRRVMASCTLGGHLDTPTDLRNVLGPMLSDPQLHALCDVVLIVDGERFPAHRAVLAAASRVFKAMFTTLMKERTSAEIELGCLNARIWRLVMDYIYRAKVDLQNEEDALILLATARMYALERLEWFVTRFLTTRVSIANALRLLDAAERFELMGLSDVCFLAMERDFGALVAAPAFGKCPLRVVERLLTSGGLVVRSELAVFDAVMTWVEAKATERVGLTDRLLEKVKIERMSDGEVKQAGRHCGVKMARGFREKVFDRLVRMNGGVEGREDTEQALVQGSHLKARRRDAKVFTIAHTLRGVTRNVNGGVDDEEVVRTTWMTDESGKTMWRLKIYPRGYGKARGGFLSMYVQARSARRCETVDVTGRFDIFLVNRGEVGSTITHSSQHHFKESSDHWGFHRFLQLTHLHNVSTGFLDEESDSIIVGANVYM